MSIILECTSGADLVYQFICKGSPSKLFYVHDFYKLLYQTTNSVSGLEEPLLLALSGVWRNKIQPKIMLFGWRLFLNILQSREQLKIIRILINTHDLHWVFCFLEEENIEHLLF